MTRLHSFFTALLLASAVHAQVVDFEKTPTGATPTDNAAISVPYTLIGGGTVGFFFDVNGNNLFDTPDIRPLYEAAGNSDSGIGFNNAALGVADTAAPAYASQLGAWFARPPSAGTVPGPFIVDYNTSQTIAALSGEIWDIEGTPTQTEQWRVEVLDNSNTVLASQLSPLGNNNALDAKPWTFTFSSLPAGVDKVRITFVGTAVGGAGLAFNNFRPTTVPEPATLGLICVAAALLQRRRRTV